jgi:hypothetical protein
MTSCAVILCAANTNCCQGNNQAWCCGVGLSCGASFNTCSAAAPDNAAGSNTSVIVGVSVTGGVLLILAIGYYFYTKWRRAKKEGMYQETTIADLQQEDDRRQHDERGSKQNKEANEQNKRTGDGFSDLKGDEKNNSSSKTAKKSSSRAFPGEIALVMTKEGTMQPVPRSSLRIAGENDDDDPDAVGVDYGDDNNAKHVQKIVAQQQQSNVMSQRRSANTLTFGGGNNNNENDQPQKTEKTSSSKQQNEKAEVKAPEIVVADETKKDEPSKPAENTNNNDDEKDNEDPK